MNIELLGLGAVFGSVGLPFFYIARRTFKRNGAQKRWPKVRGLVTVSRLHSSIERSRDKEGYDIEYVRYEACIEYDYHVGGFDYHGTGIAQSYVGGSHKPSLKIVDRYPVGARPTVLYNPVDPKIAWLEVHRSVGAIILTAFGGLWFGIGLLLASLGMFAS